MNEDVVARVVNTIVATAKTGTVGDGKLVVIPVSSTVHIRIEEQVETALTIEEPAALSNPQKN